MHKQNTWIEKQTSLFKEIDIVFNVYKYNYTCKPWDEDKVGLNKLKDVTNNLSKDEFMEVINYIVNYVKWYENKDNHNLNRDNLFIYWKGLELIEFITTNNKIKDSKINDNIKDILEKK